MTGSPLDAYPYSSIFEAQHARNIAASFTGPTAEGIARALRERICMALIASPSSCSGYDIVERATAIEAYINGTTKP